MIFLKKIYHNESALRPTYLRFIYEKMSAEKNKKNLTNKIKKCLTKY